MTELLYHNDAYLKEIRAKVLQVEGRKILLEKTIFFPPGAHNPGDTGRIDGIAVLGVIMQESDTWHVLSGNHSLKAGDSALLTLDWRKRHYLMRLHTAAHLLSDVFKRYFRIYSSRIDVAGPAAHIVFVAEINIQTIGEALKKASELIADGADVDNYSGITEKEVRIGTFPEFSCNGLFVKNIKEIGAISLDGAGTKKEGFELAIRVEDIKKI